MSKQMRLLVGIVLVLSGLVGSALNDALVSGNFMLFIVCGCVALGGIGLIGVSLRTR